MRVAFWSDGNQMTFHNWAAQDPNQNLECVFMNGTDGKWYMDGCDKQMTYFCKAAPSEQSLLPLLTVLRIVLS